ncbi:MAG TPA: metallophosphoesterase family protein [Saprospiraceae bacterium]|nr:metallophosphoesterase family protein [Saprospiraceae bacterium]
MNTSYAIGDLHGCSKTFRKLVLDVIKLKKTDELYCLGDYVDRGPDSKGVIDFILELREQGYHVFTLRGNHDQMMMDSNSNYEKFRHWVQNGGNATLKSFGIESYDELDSKYKTFLYETQYYFEIGNYILVHAGLNFRYDDPLEDTHAMMWIRGFSVDEKKLAGRIIVHGHTPLALDVIREQAGQHVIDIDGGCVYKQLTGLGHLVALNLTNGEFIAEENCE